jgi:hypothetical protein
MAQNLRDQWWVLDAGDHSELATARANGTSARLLALCANRHAALACALGKSRSYRVLLSPLTYIPVGNVDGEDPFEPLHPLDRSPGAAKHMDVRERPTHVCQGLVAIHRALRSLRHDAITMLKVRGENTRDGFAPLLFALCAKRAVTPTCAMKPSQVHPRSGH